MNRPVQPTSTDSPQGRERVEPWLARFGSWLLVAIALLVLLPWTQSLPLLDEDEPINAEKAREMMDAHEWVVPLFNGQPDLEKPPLVFWLMRACYSVLGANGFAARLPSVLATIGLALVVNAIGRRWFSARVGFAAAFGLLTCVQVLIVGHAAVMDMPMVFSVAVAEYACFRLLRHQESRYPWRWFVAMYGALGLGFLAKGPIAVVVVVLTLLFHRFLIWRQPIAWRNLGLPWGLAMLAGIVAVWAVPVMIKTHGLAWQIGIRKQVIQGATQSFNDRPYFVAYYAVTALVSLLPWIAFAGDGIRALRRRWNETNAWLISWLLGLPIALSFYASQLPHYVLPSFPAFFLIVAQIVDRQHSPGRWAKVWFRLVMSLYLLGIAGIGIFCVSTDFVSPYTALRTAALSIAVIVAGLAGLGLGYRFHSYAGMGAALVVVAIVPLVLGSALRQVTPAVQLQALFDQLPPDAECVAYGHPRFSLLFYSHRRWAFPKEISELRTMAQKPGARVLVLEESRVDVADYFGRRFGGGTRATVSVRDWMTELNVSNYNVRRIEGIDTLDPAWMKLVVFYRN